MTHLWMYSNEPTRDCSACLWVLSLCLHILHISIISPVMRFWWCQLFSEYNGALSMIQLIECYKELYTKQQQTKRTNTSMYLCVTWHCHPAYKRLSGRPFNIQGGGMVFTSEFSAVTVHSNIKINSTHVFVWICAVF